MPDDEARDDEARREPQPPLKLTHSIRVTGVPPHLFPYIPQPFSCSDLYSRNSSRPYTPASRPCPDCLKPPNGAFMLNAPPLMSIWPARMRRATRCARASSFDHTAPARPYTESLAMRTASSSSWYGMIESTGPKISSCAMVMLFLTLPNTVGRT